MIAIGNLKKNKCKSLINSAILIKNADYGWENQNINENINCKGNTTDTFKFMSV